MQDRKALVKLTLLVLLVVKIIITKTRTFVYFRNSPYLVMDNFNTFSCNDPILNIPAVKRKTEMTALVVFLSEIGPFCKFLV